MKEEILYTFRIIYKTSFVLLMSKLLKRKIMSNENEKKLSHWGKGTGEPWREQMEVETINDIVNIYKNLQRIN